MRTINLPGANNWIKGLLSSHDYLASLLLSNVAVVGLKDRIGFGKKN